MRKLAIAAAALCLIQASPAWAEIKIGAILSLTGPAASLGIPEKNTIELLPARVAGETVRYIILDDASDPTAAVRAARKLVDEEKVDLIIGPSVTPNSLAVLEVIGSSQTPMISLAGSAVIAAPVEGHKRWAFKLAPQEPTQGAYIFRSMEKLGLKTVGFIGFNDAFGDSFIGALKQVAAERGVKVLADERYNRNDTSVTAQALKILAANPDAVIIGASGTPGVTPVLELKKVGYKGQVYINQGMANADVLRVGGADLNGVLMPVSPVLVAEQLPDSNPTKPVGLNYLKIYEGKYGAGSRNLFGATAWDAFMIAEKAIPQALSKAKPGSVEFRTALRDAIETGKEVVGSQGVFNMTPTDHNGTDMRAQVLVRVENGGWKYVPLE
jgi:branched-chain amino acid transport system substrate-binding protein